MPGKTKIGAHADAANPSLRRCCLAAPAHNERKQRGNGHSSLLCNLRLPNLCQAATPQLAIVLRSLAAPERPEVIVSASRNFSSAHGNGSLHASNITSAPCNFCLLPVGTWIYHEPRHAEFSQEGVKVGLNSRYHYRPLDIPRPNIARKRLLTVPD